MLRGVPETARFLWTVRQNPIRFAFNGAIEAENFFPARTTAPSSNEQRQRSYIDLVSVRDSLPSQRFFIFSPVGFFFAD